MANNFEQILIRMGVDAKAVVVGLNATSITLKAWSNQISGLFSAPFATAKKVATKWGEEMLETLKGTVGRFFAAEFAIESFRKIGEEILEIKRLSEETGESTNFIQSLMLEAKISGTSLEALTTPLIHFNRLIGEAKLGVPDAIIALKDMGVIMNSNEVSTLDYAKSMHALKVQFDELHDRQKQDALLNQAFGKGGFRMFPVFNKPMEEFDKMNEGNFFTKISPRTISELTTAWSSVKATGQVALATLANASGSVLNVIERTGHAIGLRTTDRKKLDEFESKLAETQKSQLADQMAQNIADQDGISVAEEKAKILSEQNQLLEQQREIQAQIDDRGKSTIQQMAANARRRLGIPEPRNLGPVSARERQALTIDTLEKQSTIAFQQGKDDLFQSKRNQADQLRAGFQGGTYADTHPTAKMEIELEQANLKLGPMQKAAELILNTHNSPQ